MKPFWICCFYECNSKIFSINPRSFTSGKKTHKTSVVFPQKKLIIRHQSIFPKKNLTIKHQSIFPFRELVMKWPIAKAKDKNRTWEAAHLLHRRGEVIKCNLNPLPQMGC
jgi:hypothetical protein